MQLLLMIIISITLFVVFQGVGYYILRVIKKRNLKLSYCTGWGLWVFFAIRGLFDLVFNIFFVLKLRDIVSFMLVHYPINIPYLTIILLLLWGGLMYIEMFIRKPLQVESVGSGDVLKKSDD